MEILRIILIILGCIFTFLFLLCALIVFCRTKVELVFGDRKLVRIHFLFLHYTIVSDKKSSRKKKKDEKKQTEKIKKESENKKTDNSEKKSYKTYEKSRNITEILTIIYAVVKRFLNRLYFNLVEVNINVATPEADRTAILYGQINAGIYPILGLIDSAGQLGKAKINIIPDFTSQKTSFNTHIIIASRGLDLLVFLLYLRKKQII